MDLLIYVVGWFVGGVRVLLKMVVDDVMMKVWMLVVIVVFSMVWVLMMFVFRNV